MIADAQAAGVSLLDGPGGLIGQLTARVIERALGAELVKLAHDRGWKIQVVATPAALEFFDEHAIADQTGSPVRSQYAKPGAPRSLIPDAILVAPATYNAINKWAQGISDTYALDGCAPTSRELLHIANDATLQSRKGKDAGPVDWDALAARWDARLSGELAGVAPAVSNACGPGAQASEHHSGRAPTGPPAREAQARALAKALTLVSDKHPAWTRHDLLKQLALVLPLQTRQMSPEYDTLPQATDHSRIVRDRKHSRTVTPSFT